MRVVIDCKVVKFLPRLDMSNLIYASNVYTLLTTNESGVFCILFAQCENERSGG